MARVQYGGIITDIKGSIGGITFQTNAASKIARIKPSRNKRNSVKQNSQITSFQQNLSPWSLFDAGEKSAWDTFAAAHTKFNKWNEEKNLSGFNWFMSLNNNLTLINESLITSPPAWSTPKVVDDYTVAAVYDDFSINFSPSFAHTDDYLVLFTSSLLKTVSLFNRKSLRLTKIISPATTSAIDFLTDWQAAHNIAVPIAGSPSRQFIFTAIFAIHKTKGIAGVYNTNLGEYEPT